MSATVEFKITQDRSARLPAEIREALLKLERQEAEEVRADAEEHAPHHEQNRIGKSVRVEEHPRKSTPEVWVGLGGYWAYLGRFHEFGTVKMSAHPFMTPAAERARARYPDRAAEAINRVTEG